VNVTKDKGKGKGSSKGSGKGKDKGKGKGKGKPDLSKMKCAMNDTKHGGPGCKYGKECIMSHDPFDNQAEWDKAWKPKWFRDKMAKGESGDKAPSPPKADPNHDRNRSKNRRLASIPPKPQRLVTLDRYCNKFLACTNKAVDGGTCIKSHVEEKEYRSNEKIDKERLAAALERWEAKYGDSNGNAKRRSGTPRGGKNQS
jgi:hypothetical protein